MIGEDWFAISDVVLCWTRMRTYFYKLFAEMLN